jgi:hypothetical protein
LERERERERERFDLLIASICLKYEYTRATQVSICKINTTNTYHLTVHKWCYGSVYEKFKSIYELFNMMLKKRRKKVIHIFSSKDHSFISLSKKKDHRFITDTKRESGILVNLLMETISLQILFDPLIIFGNKYMN